MEVLANSPTVAATRPDHLAANLAALRLITPAACDAIRHAAPPASLQEAFARDGAPTFTWTDADQRLHWLGRTTMPEIRAEAIVESLQQGIGNLLMYGVAQGAEARRIPARLADYQALFVIEPDCWRMKLALTLHDFTREIERRRLLPFAGCDAWTQSRTFLEEHEGFLIPARILSWPWFDKEASAFVAGELNAMQEKVSQARAARDRSPTMPPIRHDDPSKPRVAILSNSLDPLSHRLARRMAAGAAAANLDALCIPFDSPTMINPSCVARTLTDFAPTRSFIIDGTPNALSYALPPGDIALVCTAGHLPSEEHLRATHEGVALFVHTERERALAVDRGLSPDRVTLLPPSALPGLPTLAEASADRSRRILILDDRIDTAAESVGLHLTSHRRIWDAARRLIADRPDAFNDSKAESTLAAAERDLGITLESVEVRRGLADRIRAILGPGLFQKAFLDTLARAGLEFSLVGRGWASDKTHGRHWRGAWWQEPGTSTDPGEGSPRGLITSAVESLARDHDIVLFPRPIEAFAPWFLDALAAGLAGLVRCRPNAPLPAGLNAVLDAATDVALFQSGREAVAMASNCRGAADRTRRTAEKVRAGHTWAQTMARMVAMAIEP